MEYMSKKKKISFYSFTSCEGCMMNVLLWLYKNYDFFIDNFEINNMRILTPMTSKDNDDIAVIEGAISSRDQVKKVNEIRRRAKIVIVIGSCALIGAPSNNRNFLPRDKKMEEYIKKFNQLDKVIAVKDIIKVDYEVPGCPMLLEQFDKIIKEVVSRDA